MKKHIVPRSSEEAKLQATTSLTAEVTWLRWLLEDLGVFVTTTAIW
jgi:hypothetical protein